MDETVAKKEGDADQQQTNENGEEELTEEQKKAKQDLEAENKYVHFGSVFVDSKEISKIY